MQEYESGDTSKINATLYKTLKSELADVERALGEPINNKEEKESMKVIRTSD